MSQSAMARRPPSLDHLPDPLWSEDFAAFLAEPLQFNRNSKELATRNNLVTFLVNRFFDPWSARSATDGSTLQTNPTSREDYVLFNPWLRMLIIIQHNPYFGKCLRSRQPVASENLDLTRVHAERLLHLAPRWDQELPKPPSDLRGYYRGAAADVTQLLSTLLELLLPTETKQSLLPFFKRWRDRFSSDSNSVSLGNVCFRIVLQLTPAQDQDPRVRGHTKKVKKTLKGWNQCRFPICNVDSGDLKIIARFNTRHHDTRKNGGHIGIHVDPIEFSKIGLTTPDYSVVAKCLYQPFSIFPRTVIFPSIPTMPSLTTPLLPHYEPAPVTKEPLDYAQLPIVDLSQFADPAARSQLINQVRSAMVQHGFFYIINHGLSSAQIARMFDIADVPFSQVDDDEKQKYQSRLKETGTQQGYKPRQYYHIDNGIKDQFEIYGCKGNHPEALRPFLPELDRFAQHCHMNVLHPILRLLSLGLELPEETLVNYHQWKDNSETYVRFMKYYPRSEEEESKTNNLWLKGHTDIGSITLLFSQPVAALQIRTGEGSWKWVKHIENAIVVNAGDAIEFLSGGAYMATIHRVVQPPPDQRGYTRLGLFYFALAREDLKLKPLAESPILQRTDSGWVNQRFSSTDIPTMEEWRKGRTKSYGNAELKTSLTKGVEEEYLNNVLIKHYV
ncbi:hypothetical protein D9757_000813 [Collybiopsis confluens]|uniref:Clavaminate synthase-like protein n=1 Tax=Collybiopsis confluens TaxID=2823264 RepID=A0A8H5MGK1_9AGAR|nr:hypothetical protein D9757_000813 [Collybiopsis confluens]